MWNRVKFKFNFDTASRTFFSSFLSFFRSFSSFFARSRAAWDSAFVIESICFFNNLRSLNL